MADTPTPNPEPEKVTPTGGAVVVDSGNTAERYIATELQKARAGLRMSQGISVALLLIAGIYLLFITSKFQSSLEPHHAAEIADGMIMQQVNDQGPELAKQIKEKIPEYIEKTPDYALAELPKYREQVADKIEQDLTKYSDSTSQQLVKQLDELLEQHKDHVKELLTSGNDPNAVKQVGDDMKQTLVAYIKEKPASGESVGDQIDKALESLQDVEKHVHRLATAKDLSPQEKKARRAIAILTQGIDAHKELQIMPNPSASPDASTVPDASSASPDSVPVKHSAVTPPSVKNDKMSGVAPLKPQPVPGTTSPVK